MTKPDFPDPFPGLFSITPLYFPISWKHFCSSFANLLTNARRLRICTFVYRLRSIKVATHGPVGLSVMPAQAAGENMKTRSSIRPTAGLRRRIETFVGFGRPAKLPNGLILFHSPRAILHCVLHCTALSWGFFIKKNVSRERISVYWRFY